MMLSDVPSRELLTADLTALMIHLAACTRRAAYGQQHQLDTIAHETLQLVLAFCQAQRGALLLWDEQEHPRAIEDDVQPALALRALALQEIQEDEAAAVLQGGFLRPMRRSTPLT